MSYLSGVVFLLFSIIALHQTDGIFLQTEKRFVEIFQTGEPRGLLDQYVDLVVIVNVQKRTVCRLKQPVSKK